jgi:CDP-diglyceride synthetase
LGKKKLTRKEQLAVISFAALANAVFFGVIFALTWYEIDYEKWFALAVWTALVFGGLVYLSGHGLWKVRGLLIFGALLAIHLVASIVYLLSVSHFPNLLFLVGAPVEAAIAAFILGTIGGVRPRLLRHRMHQQRGRLWVTKDDSKQGSSEP